MVAVGLSAETAYTESEWAAVVDHRREAARLRQRAEITRMSDAEQVFWFGETHAAAAERHLRAAMAIELRAADRV
jgi:hypothetical protein